jgi:hypothetical protein
MSVPDDERARPRTRYDFTINWRSYEGIIQVKLVIVPRNGKMPVRGI